MWLCLTPLVGLSFACQKSAAPTTPLPPGTHAGYYVSPNGSATGDGSSERPWDLASVLAKSTPVLPGDTIWLRGGTYTGTFISRLTGTASSPIIVRQYPGERATINGTMTINGRDTWYWGFEVANTNPTSVSVIGVDVFAPRSRFINLTVHDHSGSGFGVWDAAADVELYGNIIYNNGYHGGSGSGYAHGIYAQNVTGGKRFVNNMVFYQFNYGFHFYTDAAFEYNMYLEGNVAFMNGAPQLVRQQPNIFIGAGNSQAARGITLLGNMTYKTSNDGSDVWLGYGAAQNQDIVLQNNYFTGGYPTLRVRNWGQATVTGNTLYSRVQIVDLAGAIAGHAWSGNVWCDTLTSLAWLFNNQAHTYASWQAATGFTADQAGPLHPSGTKIVVEPNQYEPGRGNIIVYNWDLAGSVQVDLSGVLSVGDGYEVRNVQNYFGTPILTGTYGGGAVTLPMTAVPPPPSVGGWLVTPPTTGPEFNVYVVRRVGS
jgi:hypothetical protein